MPLVSGVSMLMTRNLLYTGVTRAKKCVCIVGRKETFSAMIANEDQHRRYSGLKWQLVNYYNEEQLNKGEHWEYSKNNTGKTFLSKCLSYMQSGYRNESKNMQRM